MNSVHGTCGSRMAANIGCSKQEALSWSLGLGLVPGYFGKGPLTPPSITCGWVGSFLVGLGNTSRQLVRVDILVSCPLSVAPVP